MKLPFDLGVKLLFRLLLPGFVFTLGLSPILFFGLDWIQWQESHVYVLIIVIVVSGWLLLVLDMPIYMAFEGRRFWPDWLRKLLVRREELRLADLLKRAAVSKLESIEDREAELENEIDQAARDEAQQQIDSDERDYIEANFDLRNFGMDSSGEYRAKFPTRLGNLLSAYEGYSARVYGMDTMFYWPRIWLKLDKDVREEIDNRQSIVDSTVYVAFACFASGLLWSIYGILGSVNALVLFLNRGTAIVAFKHTLFDHLPRWWLSWLWAVLFLLTGFLVYRTSLRLHAQFGEVFKSVFDVFRDEISVTSVVKDLAKDLGDYSLPGKSRKEQFEIAFGYLQFDLVHCPVCEKRISFTKMAAHRELEKKSAASSSTQGS